MIPGDMKEFLIDILGLNLINQINQMYLSPRLNRLKERCEIMVFTMHDGEKGRKKDKDKMLFDYSCYKLSNELSDLSEVIISMIHHINDVETLDDILTNILYNSSMCDPVLLQQQIGEISSFYHYVWGDDKENKNYR